jgi:uncharacterized cupin superfamily protein
MSEIPTISFDAELESYSLPAESLISGDTNPLGKSVTLEQPGGVKVTAGVFAASPGVIRNPVGAVETVVVLEGEVLIELDTGQEVSLGAGDITVLPAGVTATWTFKSPFKQLYILSSPSRVSSAWEENG